MKLIMRKKGTINYKKNLNDFNGNGVLGWLNYNW